MSNENEKIRQTYNLASNLMNEGKSDEQITEALISQGLDQTAASNVISNLKKERSTIGTGSGKQSYNGGGSGFGFSGIPKWLIYILGLLLINLVSYLFNLNFWIY